MRRKGQESGIQVDAAGNKTVDKRVYGQRIYRRLGPISYDEAKRYLDEQVANIRKQVLFGESAVRTFRQAAVRYLEDSKANASIDDDALVIRRLDQWIGAKPIIQIHDETLKPYKRHRVSTDRVSQTTLKRDLEVVRKIINRCTHTYIDEYTGKPWLERAPKITMPSKKELNQRKPEPLSWEDQRTFFPKLPRWLARMALFALNTGCRDQEVCHLQWEWEQPIHELNTTVFVVPRDFGGRRRNSGVKNREPRLVVLNAIARSVVEECRSEQQHARQKAIAEGSPAPVFNYVFTTPKYKTKPAEMNTNKWKEVRQECGLRLRVHDLKHTFGRRLRAAGVPYETRQVLLGHTTGDVTIHYSPAEIQELIDAVEKLTASPVTVLREIPGRFTRISRSRR